MIDERQQEFASLYVLDLLEGAELSAFEADLAANPELRKLIDELRESAVNFALSAPQLAPPPELKTRILGKLGNAGVPPDNRDNVVRPATFTFARMLPWAIAAGVTLGCLGLGQLYLATRTENSLLRDQQTLVDLELRSARQQAEAERILFKRQLADNRQQLAGLDAQLTQSARQLTDSNRKIDDASGQLAQLQQALSKASQQIADLREKLQSQGDLAQFKIATLASLAGNSPQALAVAVWNPATQEGVLRVEKLPALASDKDYQLWVIDPAYPIPVDGGVFTVDPATGDARITFHLNKRVNNAAKFAVSLERKGGVPKAEGPMVLLGD